MTASYLLLTPHYLPGGYTPAGTVVTEGVQIPVGWVPTMAVDPQTSDAITAFWNAGPLPDAEPNRDLYPFSPAVQPVVYWKPVAGVANYFVLTGAGAPLGTKSAPTPLPLLPITFTQLTSMIQVGATLGTLSVAGYVGTPTYSFVSNPGGYFSISGNSLVVAQAVPVGTVVLTIQGQGANLTAISTFIFQTIAAPANLAPTGLPLDGNMLNVKAFGAMGDGVTDDTAAILAAIAALPVYETTFNTFARPIYFPAGTYLVSNTLMRTATNIRANTPFIGEDPATTTIKLKNSCSGYGSTASPKAVILTSSGNIFGQSPNANTTGEGNEAFNCTIQNLTINTGTGNPGAIAIDWVVHNIGAIRNVNITTSGAAFAAIVPRRSYIGPGLATNIAISGPFSYGILGFTLASPAGNGADPAFVNDGLLIGWEHITITGTTVTAILNTCYNWAFRDVAITVAGGYGLDITDGTGIQLVAPGGANEGVIVWVDGTIGGTGTAPINGSGGYRNWTNVRQVNFNGTNNVDLSGVYTQGTITGASNWQITPKNHPVPPVVATNTWTKIVAPTWPQDAGPAIQAALNASTSPVAYLPWGYYKIEETITIPNNIQRIEFLYSFLAPQGGGYYLFETNNTRTLDLFINNCMGFNAPGGLTAFFHWKAPSPSRLVITDTSLNGEIIYRDSAGGEIYLSNVNSPHLEINGPAGVFGRQYNPEVGSRKIFNYGTAPIWMFAMKGEQDSAIYESDGVANFEWVGGFQYVGDEQTDPLVVLTAGGRFSGAFATASLSSTAKVDTIVNSVIGGITNTVPYTLFPKRGAYNGATCIALSTDNFIPLISFPNVSIVSSSTVGTVVGTATLINYAFTGTPVWSLTNNAGGKYAINSSTGVVTVASALSVTIDHITIAVSGITSGASGTPGQPTPLIGNINVVLTLSSFDPSKKATGITLSNNNLTMTANTTNSGGQCALTVTSHSSGKYYVVFNVTNNGSGGSLGVGFGNASAVFAEGSYFAQDNNGFLFVSQTWYSNGVGHGGYDPWYGAGSTATVGMAIDVTAQKAWITLNGGTTWNSDIITNQNPVGNVGGISFSNVTGAIFLGGECDFNTNQIILNPTPASPPSGYGAW